MCPRRPVEVQIERLTVSGIFGWTVATTLALFLPKVAVISVKLMSLITPQVILDAKPSFPLIVHLKLLGQDV